MKVIVAGSRTFDYGKHKDLFDKTLDEFDKQHNISEIVSGMARGADQAGEEYADKNNIKIARFPANWRLFGNSAGHIRNREMAAYADGAIVFWDGYSRGTKNMIEEMEKLHKPVQIIIFEE